MKHAFRLLVVCLLALTMVSAPLCGALAESAAVELTLEGGKYGYPNPFRCTSQGPSTFKMQMVYDSLFIKDETGLQPWLATGHTMSADGLQYTFEIRQGVKWHDGQDLTPADVVFTFEYYRDHLPASSALMVNNEYRIVSVADNGDNTVTFTMDRPLATDLAAISYVPIIPKHIWENIDDPYNYTGEGDCVGSGPYCLTDINAEIGEYKFEAFGDYWGKHLVDSVAFIAVSDNVLAFDNGHIDYLNAPWDLYEKYANDESCSAVENQAFLGWNLKYNMVKNPELADVNVRKAIAYAIDREQILNLVLRGHGYVASAAYLPVGHVMRNDDIAVYEFNPEKAVELLGGNNYEYTLVCGDNQDTIKICELVAMYLGDVGIKVTVQSMDTSSCTAAVREGNYDMTMTYGGGWGNDADSLRTMYAGYDPEAGVTLSTSACLGYYNEEIYNLAQAQLSCVDPEERTEMIKQLQALIAEEVPCLPIINAVDMLVTRPADYDGWRFKYDHNYSDSCKLSFVTWAE